MNKGKLLIFDLDGTLFRTELVDVEAVNRALIKNGLPERNSEFILSLIGDPTDTFIRKLAPQADEATLNKITQDFMDFEVELVLSRGELYPGTISALYEMKKDGNVLCICTYGGESYVNCIIEKFNFERIFDSIFYKRPDIDKVEAIRLFKDKYKKPVNVVIGDRYIDFHAAKCNNCISIATSYGFGGDEKYQADYIADSVSEVAKIVNSL